MKLFITIRHSLSIGLRKKLSWHSRKNKSPSLLHFGCEASSFSSFSLNLMSCLIDKCQTFYDFVRLMYIFRFLKIFSRSPNLPTKNKSKLAILSSYTVRCSAGNKNKALSLKKYFIFLAHKFPLKIANSQCF